MSRRRRDPIATAIAAQTTFIRSVLARRGVPDSDIDGLATEVMFSTWKAAKSGRVNAYDVEFLRRWVTVVAQRRAADHRRTTLRRAQLEGHRPYIEPGDTESQYAAREALRIIVENISPAERALFKAVIDGVTLAEVAARTGTPPGTVASRLMRTRDRLLALLRRK